MVRSASAKWHGNLPQGSGTISTESGVLQESPYSFNTRFGDVKGTNPEELIGAAHAGCFSMALSHALSGAGFTAESIATTAKVTVEQIDGNFAITKVHLDLNASVPNLDDAKFQEIAANAKANCPVSKVLRADITLSAVLS